MTGLKALLTTIIVAILTCAFGFILWKYIGLTKIEAGLVAAVLFLGVGLCASLLSKEKEVSHISSEMEDLSRSVSVLAQDLHNSMQRMDTQEHEVEKKLEAHQETLSQQMKLLEDFLTELKSGLGTKSPSRTTYKPTQNSAEAQVETIIEDEATRLEEVRQALEDNRIDLYLQPIVSLPQRKTRLYEGFTRLRNTAGRVILPQQYLPLAAEAGLMPVLDNQLLFKCVQVMRRLVKRQKDLGIVCNISGHSLLDHEFFPQFIEFMDVNRELASSLVFELSQETIKNCGPIEYENLASLADMGFVFSMDQVTDMDIDLEGLARKSFKYLKVESETFINGMEQAGAQIHAADLATLAARYGIDLIIEKIEDENTVLNVIDFKVPFGQGFLFGKPRLVRGDVLKEDEGSKTAA